MSIRNKLIIFSAFYCALILFLIVTITFSADRIELSYLNKEKVYQLVRFTQNARIAEKSYLRYYQDIYADELNYACVDILSSLKEIDIPKERIDEFTSDINTYKRGFNRIVDAYKILVDIRSRMKIYADKIKDLSNSLFNDLVSEEFKLQLEGKSIDSNRIGLKITVGTAYNIILELYTIYQQFLVEGEIAHIYSFEKTLKSVLDFQIINLKNYAERVKNANYLAIVQRIQETFVFCQDIPKQSILAFESNKKGLQALDFIGNKISMTADTLLAESNTKKESLKNAMIVFVVLFTFVGITFAIALGVFFNKMITEGLNQLLKATHSLANGDLTTRVKVISKDEIGSIGFSFNSFIEIFQKIIRDVEENTNILNSSSTDLTDTSNNLNQSVDQVKARTAIVVKTGEELSNTICIMASSAERISIASDNVTKSVKDMSKSIKEVSKQCSKESIIAKKANERMKETKDIINRLGKAAEKIGQIVEFINQMADQTNLLALNANIEASDSLNMHNGFAVVANEIKSLAQGSADATVQITREIREVQKDISVSVNSINDVSEIIQEVSEISETIAHFVAEQSTVINNIAKTMSETSFATNELAKNVQEIANSSEDVSKNIQEINFSSDQTAESAIGTLNSSESLAKMAARLKKSIRQFKI